VDRRERERILGEHGLAPAPAKPTPPLLRGSVDPTPRSRAHTVLERKLADRLAEDLEGSPLSGRPLPRRLRNFSLAADRYAVSLAGPPAYSRRLREIEDETAAHEQALHAAWNELARRHRGDLAVLARRWRAIAGRWDFTAVNMLIVQHNAYYPVEARLGMDPRTGDFVLVGGVPYRRRPLNAMWALERFPAELESALAPAKAGTYALGAAQSSLRR
jgi:hypothetical protein